MSLKKLKIFQGYRVLFILLCSNDFLIVRTCRACSTGNIVILTFLQKYYIKLYKLKQPLLSAFQGTEGLFDGG